ncbi:MAG: biotin/lipoyl-binding protein, partial [Candidatus Omnitrophota bacterium]
MKHKKWIAAACIILAAVLLWPKDKSSGRVASEIKPIQPMIGDIQKFITCTGTVQPQNRLEMKPPIAGRVEKIFFEEGQAVKIGDIVALMSSADRAALLDAARPQGAQAIEYWQEVYKPTPLIAPIDGEVIVRTVQPGQSVTTADAV